MDENYLGIYIHIPFCVRKCPYCGFFSRTNVDEDIIRVYKDGVIADIKRFAEMYSEGRIVDSIFFGGGTPTAISEDYIIEILDSIKEDFKVSTDCEITIEANPGTLGEENELSEYKLQKLVAAGFNRISIGVQSFDDEVLKTLGRIHDSKQAEASIKAARTAGFDIINVDLMFGIPGQTMTKWRRTLEKALELRPEHISFYSLQLEEGTPFLKRFEEGDFDELSDELDRAMYHEAIRSFKDTGYKHYEISNAAFPGFECRHNLKYWTLGEYLGIGASASSYIEGKRYTFSDSLETYRLSEYNENTKFDDMSEYTFTGLRLIRGIDYSDFYRRFGIRFREAFSDRWDELAEFFDSGALVEYVDNEGTPVNLRLSESGIDISNQIMSVFV